MFTAPAAVRRFSNRRLEQRAGDEDNDEEEGEEDGGTGGAGHEEGTRRLDDQLYGRGPTLHRRSIANGGSDHEGVEGEYEAQDRVSRSWTYKCGNLVRSKAEEAARRKEAKQRWKILCLVRTFHGADGVDELTRQERLKTRVDDWMAGFVAKLKISAVEESSAGKSHNQATTNERKSRDSGLDSAEFDTNSSSLLLLNKSSPLPPIRAKSEMRQSRVMARRAYESEQRDRMNERAERERERIRTEKFRRRMNRSPHRMQVEEQKELIATSSPQIRNTLLMAAMGVDDGRSGKNRPISGRALSPIGKGKAQRTSGRKNSKQKASSSSRSTSPAKKESTAKRTAKMNIKMKKVKRQREVTGLLLPPMQPNYKSDDSNNDNAGCTPHEKKRKKKKRRRRKSSSDRGLASSSSMEMHTGGGVGGGGGDGDLHSMLEEATETVVANLMFDERTGDLLDHMPHLSDDDCAEGELQTDAASGKQRAGNPVFHAFEQARGVDDLYRIAEIWVNPTYYGLNQDSS